MEQGSTDLHKNIESKLKLYDYIKFNGYFIASQYKNFIDVIENFEVRDDDIWVCSFPKTGKSTEIIHSTKIFDQIIANIVITK